jgi:uncharacterized protein YjiS (DUF1127 family)
MSLLTPCWQQAFDRKNGPARLPDSGLENMAMTVLTNMQTTAATRPFALRTAVRLAHLRRFINRFFAAVIARHERHAARAVLHQLDDRQLTDLGIYRAQIGSSLEDLAQTRARLQQPGWP